MSTRHVDVLASAIDDLDPTVAVELLDGERGLVELARRATPDTFGTALRQRIDTLRADGGMPRLERQRRDSRAHCTPDPDTGMYCLFAEIDPDRGTAIAQAIQTHTDRLYQTPGATDGLTSQQVRAQAVYELITRTAADEPCRHEVLVLIDHRSAVAGLHPDTVCETAEGVRLPVPHVRALCATATITAAVLDATGAALAVGRDERIATRPQRRALRAMYRTCAFPGCDVPFDRCHVHHVEHWEHGGSTDLANLLPLCHRHHHLVHDGGWRLTIDHQRTLRWHRPDGTLEHEMPFEPLLHCGASTDRPVSPGDPPPSSHHEAPPTGRAPPSPTAA